MTVNITDLPEHKVYLNGNEMRDKYFDLVRQLKYMQKIKWKYVK